MSAPILIMGATSGVGAKAVEEALSRGLAVRAFARGADKLDPTPKLEPFAGDALKAEDVARALEGVRAVIYALGIRERVSMLWEEETLFSETTKVLLAEMPKAGVTRLIAVTGFGAGRSQDAMSRIERMGHRAILGRVYDDKDLQEEKILNSDLDWTIVRPVIMTKGAKGTFRVLRSPKTWRNGLVSRADVAKYLIDAIEHDLDRQADVVLAR
ncbi:NAD(P)-dependent oxidoreductase [Aestuariibius sp. 2305UL40-4]|uniref:NAD(P)-dependent oxidoreductase n=1 Tax=Aestuariibius violaceus TaxID=3234132 RepID=UPI00345EEC2E